MAVAQQTDVRGTVMSVLKILAFLAATVAEALPAHADSLPDPISPATIGQLQCYSPDTTHKTCIAIANYKSGATGTIEYVLSLVSSKPIVIMETVSPVEIKAGKICGKLQEKDIDTRSFFVAGRVLDSKQAEPLRQHLKIVLKEFFGHEICTAYEPEGKALVAKATIDGVPMRAPEQRVIWVSPSEGYTVSP